MRFVKLFTGLLIILSANTLKGQCTAEAGRDTTICATDYHIEDTSKRTPKVWPDTTTNYKATVTDSVGCQTTDSHRIYTTVKGVKSHKSIQNSISIYPNPVKKHSMLHFQKKPPHPVTVAIFNTKGRKIVQIITSEEKVPVGKMLSNASPGVYVLKRA